MTLLQTGPAGHPVHADVDWDDVEIGDAGTAACPDDCHYCSGPETD